MSCQGIRESNYRVVVKFPQSLRARCEAIWRRFWETCVRVQESLRARCEPIWRRFWETCVRVQKSLLWYMRCCGICAFYLLLIAFIGFVSVFYVWIIIIVSECHKPPGMALEDLSIRDMAVYQNNTTAAPDSPWQVDSGFNVTLATWNPNTVAGCFSTFRRMVVRVEYRGQSILQQKVPLGFGLKPRRSRPVSVELKGGHFHLKNELGPLLEAELRSNNISLKFYFDARCMRNDRKAGWLNMSCLVVTKPPSNSSQLGGNLLWNYCQ